MTVRFGGSPARVRAGRHLWLSHFTLAVYALQCLFIIWFRDGLPVKLFAALMLTSTLVVEAVVKKGRKPEGARRSAAG